MGMKHYKIAMVYLNTDDNVGVGAGYIASVILQHEHSLTFFNTNCDTIEKIKENVLSVDYDFLFISTNTLFYKIALDLAKEIKAHKSIKVLLGGIHATILKAEILKNNPYIDFICVGEGEDFVIEFLDCYDTPEFYNIQNLGYLDEDGEAHVNSIRPCTDLSSLPKLKWDLFPATSIINPGPLPGFCYVFSTRGCPYRCTYCCNTCWLDLYQKEYLRHRDINVVMEELHYLKDTYKVKTFYFADEMITFNIPYITELFHRVKNEIGLQYGCMSRVERITPEIVNLFRETGCQYVGLGIECGNEEFRKKFLNRHMTNEQIIYAFSELRKVPGLKTSSYNMKGYPVDYDAQLTKDTLELNAKLNPDFVGMSIFFPFPGTKLYDYCIENDKIDPEKFKSVTNYYTKSVLRES